MRKADNLPPSCAVVMKSGNLNFLEPSGPVEACNGTDLPSLIKEHIYIYLYVCVYSYITKGMHTKVYLYILIYI